MQYSDQNREGLLGLVAALKAGMDPQVGYGLYQDINENQMQRLAMRQERLQGLSDLLTGAASSGVPYSGAQAMAQAAPGPAGPAVQQMLEALYPTGEADMSPDLNYQGAPMSGPVGSPPGTEYVPGAGQVPTTGAGPNALSPTMPTPPQPSVGEQVQQQQLMQQQALQPLWAEFAQNASIYASQGKTREQFISDAMKAYPELFATDIQTAQQIALTAFASPTPAG